MDLCVIFCTLLAFFILFSFHGVGGEDAFKSLPYFPLCIFTETHIHRLVLRFRYGFGADHVDKRSAGCRRGPPVWIINKPLSNGFPVL